MKQLIQKLSTVFILALIVQICIGVLSYPRALPSGIALNDCTNKLVYLGDSTIDNFNINDTDKKPISSYLEDILEQRVIIVTHGAYHLGVYYGFVKYLVEHNKKPKTIIIPINMRSFSPEWDTRPAYQFKKEIFFLMNPGVIAGTLYKPLSIYTDYFNDSADKATWLDSDVDDNGLRVGKVKDYENNSYNNISPANIRNKLIYHYRYNLNSNHRKLAALNDICILARRYDQKVLFYITPIDIDFAESIYRGTAALISNNVNIVKGVITSNGLSVVDMSHSIPSDYFDWKQYPNEHMNEKGRMFVAVTLSRELKAVAQGVGQKRWLMSEGTSTALR